MRNILMTIPIVKTAIESEEASVIDALKLAFVADPATRWIWPNPQKYLSNFSNFAMMKWINTKKWQVPMRLIWMIAIHFLKYFWAILPCLLRPTTLQ